MAILGVDSKCYILALFIRSDGERFLLGSGYYEFKDSQQHFAANNIANDVIEVQGNDGYLLGGQVRRPGVQSFDGYIGDGTTSKTEVEEYRQDFLSFFRKNYTYKVVYVFPDGSAIQRKRGFLVDAPTVQELYQIYPEYHVALNFEDINYYFYDEDASGDEIYGKSAVIGLALDATGGLIWDNLGAVSLPYSWINPVEFSGSEVTITNNLDMRVALSDLQLKGDTFQQTYSGKNLFDYTDTTNVGQNITVASTGYVTCTVNNSSGSSTIYRNYFTNPLNLQPSTQYALVFEILSSSGEWKIEGGGEDQSTSQVSGYGVRSGEVTAGDTIVQIVTSKTDVSGSAGIRLYFRFLAGQSGSVTVRISVLADTSVTSETFVYEPYVGGIPAPNPDYPQEIQTVTGEQTVSILDGDESQSYKVNLGKNLFNTSRLSDSTVATGTNSIKLEKPDTRTVNAFFPSRLPAGTYTLSYDVVKGDGNTDGVRCAIYIVNAAGTGTEQLAAVSPYDGHVSYTFTAPRAVDRLYFYINMPQPDGATVEINNIQVEKGSSETDFAAYVEPIELCKIGDYQDYIYKSGDDWYVHKACGKVILDGSENYFKSGTTACDVYGTNITTDASPTTTEVISNHFVYSTSNGVGKTRKYQNSLYFGFASYGTTDITAFKTWLSTHNTIVYYILDTPTDTKITDTTLIEQLEALGAMKLFVGENNLLVTATGPNLPAVLEASYPTGIDYSGAGYEWEPGEAGGIKIITVDSIDNVYPLLSVNGPAVNPTVTNITTGTIFRYSGTVTASQTLKVDMMNKTATLNGTSVIGNVSGDWLYFQPGDNRVDYSTGNADAPSALIEWQEIVG